MNDVMIINEVWGLREGISEEGAFELQSREQEVRGRRRVPRSGKGLPT